MISKPKNDQLSPVALCEQKNLGEAALESILQMSSLQIKEPPHLWAGKKMEQGQSSGSKSVEDSRGKSCLDIGCDRNEKLVDGGIDHLMILAQSAELVEAQHHFCNLHKNNQSCEDEFHYDRQQTTRPLEDVTISGKDSARQQGRTRLTQLRRYARTKHAHTADGLPMKSSTDKLDFSKVEKIHGHDVERDLEHQDHEDRLFNCNTRVEAEANVNQASVKGQFVQVPRPSRYGMVNEKQVHSPITGVDGSIDSGQRQKGRLLQIDEQQLHKRKHLHDTACQPQLEVTGEGSREPPWVYPPFFKLYVSDRAQVLKEKQRIARQVRIKRRQRGNKQDCVPKEKAIPPTQAEKKRLRPIAPRLFWHNDHFIAHPRDKRFQGEHMVANGQVKHVGAEQQSCDTEEQHIPSTEHGEQFVNRQRASKNSHKCLNSSQEIGPSNLRANEIFPEVQSNSHQASYMKKCLAETHVEKEQNPLRVKGGVRLTHLRCQARVKYVAEKGKGLLQSNGGTKMVHG